MKRLLHFLNPDREAPDTLESWLFALAVTVLWGLSAGIGLGAVYWLLA